MFKAAGLTDDVHIIINRGSFLLTDGLGFLASPAPVESNRSTNYCSYGCKVGASSHHVPRNYKLSIIYYNQLILNHVNSLAYENYSKSVTYKCFA